MDEQLPYDILSQPDETTCGPTCLHSIYRYLGESVSLEQVIEEVGMIQSGGTLAVFLGCHALKRGYDATIYTFNLNVFDPTWFLPAGPSLRDRLLAQRELKESSRLQMATDGYINFLELGGQLKMEVLDAPLIRRYLKKRIPILTGLSSTFLYGEPRERAADDSGRRFVADDVGGVPQGHFVVMCGYDANERQVLIADPLTPNPLAKDNLYHADLDRVINAVLLGIVTYDANLLVIQPKRTKAERSQGTSHILTPANSFMSRPPTVVPGAETS